MSLAIFVHYRDSVSDAEQVGIWPAGTEDCRSKLWGSPDLHSLNLRLLPNIETDVVVRESEFDELLDECARLEGFCLSDFPGVPASKKHWWVKLKQSIALYVDNFRKAVAFARSVGAKELTVG